MTKESIDTHVCVRTFPLMKIPFLGAFIIAADARKKTAWIANPSKGAAIEIVPEVIVQELPVMEMIPAYAPPDPVNVFIFSPPPHSKDHVIHARPDLAPGLPSTLPQESISQPNWRPVAIVKPPARDPQFTPKFSFGKEPGPLFDRPAAMNKVAETGSHLVNFDAFK